MNTGTECPTCDGSGTAGHEADCPSPDDGIGICINNPCASLEAGWDPDMSLGDVCALCLCRECERCGEKIALDEETQIADGPDYIDVCERCVTTDDVHYDQQREGK